VAATGPRGLFAHGDVLRPPRAAGLLCPSGPLAHTDARRTCEAVREGPIMLVGAPAGTVPAGG